MPRRATLSPFHSRAGHPVSPLASNLHAPVTGHINDGDHRRAQGVPVQASTRSDWDVRGQA